MEAPRISKQKIKNAHVYLNGASLPIGCFPIKVERVVTEWAGFEKWTHTYLKKKFGDIDVECFIGNRKNKSFLQQVNKTHVMLFGEFLDYIFSPVEDKLLYLRISSSQQLFKELKEDFNIPDFLPDYNPSATGIWMGQKGNLTPFHHDWWHSCLAQVSGRKHYVIVHPFEMKDLIEDWPVEVQYDLASPPFVSEKDERLNELENFFTGILNPGEILYIPPYWYHQIETIDNGNISIPIRYDTSQSPDLPLFQLSQNSMLRSITNKQVSDEETLVKQMAKNHKQFEKREREIIKAFLKERNSKKRLEDVMDHIKAYS